jgi:uncharacterized protein YlxW (UPF0749 family)
MIKLELCLIAGLALSSCFVEDCSFDLPPDARSPSLAAELTTIFLMSCYSDSCLNGKSSLVQEVKARFEHFVDVVGYKGRVNVDNDGNPEIVTNDRPSMAPSDIDSLQQKADELDQQLEKLTDKMEEIITAQSQALDNIEPQTQAANATNAKVIKIKKEVEQAQDNLIQAQQSVATLEKKILRASLTLAASMFFAI